MLLGFEFVTNVELSIDDPEFDVLFWFIKLIFGLSNNLVWG